MEFGSVKTEQGFHDLYAMGAYYNVRDGVAYPAVFFATGANDPRVPPWQMTKMAARLQAATEQRPAGAAAHRLRRRPRHRIEQRAN